MKSDQELQQVFTKGYDVSQAFANRALYDAGFNDGVMFKNPQKVVPSVGVDHHSDGTQPTITGTNIVAPQHPPATPQSIAAEQTGSLGTTVLPPAGTPDALPAEAPVKAKPASEPSW